jgi:HemY protein
VKTGLLLVGTALLLGALVGTLVLRDPGYVLISYGTFAFETSIWFFFAVLVGAYLSLRLVLVLIHGTARSGSRLGGWLQSRRGQSARAQTTQGLLHMAEGRWQQARKVLTNAAKKSDAPLVNYLNAARAAQELGDLEGRDALLREAQTSTSGSKFLVGLTQAELQQAEGQWEQCLATLLRLKGEAPRHGRVLKMLLECYEALGDEQALIELLPDARKAKAIDEPAYAELLRSAWSARLRKGSEDPAELFERVPKELRKDPDVVGAYADAEAARGTPARTVAPLRAAIGRSWSAPLVARYGATEGESPKAQLAAAEGWLKAHPDDATLLLCLGRLALRNEAWDKAREYFEASLRQAQTPEVYGELGRLCAASGELERSAEYLLQAQRELPEVPLPVQEAQDRGA